MFKKLFLICSFSVIPSLSLGDEKGSEVIISVDGIQVTSEDVRHYIRERINSGMSPDVFTSGKAISQSAENVLSLRRLGKSAREAGFVTNEQIEWEVQLYRERLQHREWINSLVDTEIAATDWNAAAREEFLANPEQFNTGEDQVRVSHILISTKERDKQEAFTLAEKVLREIKSGADFTSMVEKYSEDTSAQRNNGDLGFFGRGKMVPPFEAAAFGLSKESPLSDIVESSFGYHIIKYGDSKKARKLTFDEAKSSIIATLKARAPSAIRSRLAMEARSVSTDQAEVNESALKRLEQELLSN